MGYDFSEHHWPLLRNMYSKNKKFCRFLLRVNNLYYQTYFPMTLRGMPLQN